ncbi:MAG TPA: hypothetical protein VG035_10210, partial [Actinomycetota bacterium]|nr:hypothetical protein [Actinomycetota bacterium]
ALWAEAMGRGLYDGWDAGQSAYDRPTGGAAGAPTDQDTPPGFPGPLRPDPSQPAPQGGAPPEVRRGDA